MSHTYIINKTDKELILKEGYLKVPAFGFKRISSLDSDHPHVIDAINREWAEVTEKEPVVVEKQVSKEILRTIDERVGLTDEQLKVYLENKKPATAVVTATRLGGETKLELKKEEVDSSKSDEPAKRGRKAAEKSE